MSEDSASAHIQDRDTGRHDDPHAHQGSNHEHSVHQGRRDHGAMIADFRRRLWVSLALTVPILVLSPMIQNLWWVAGYIIVPRTPDRRGPCGIGFLMSRHSGRR